MTFILTPAARTALGVALVLASCDSSSRSTPADLTPDTGLRVESNRTAGGEGDALAAALLVATGAPIERPGQAVGDWSDPGLAHRLRSMSRSHLETVALTADSGPGQLGSSYIRRLAARSSLGDRNGNGVNNDEVLLGHYRELARRADGFLPATLRPTLFPWADGVADFATQVDPGTPAAATRPGQVGTVQMAQVGYSMLARVMLASSLLKGSRGLIPGADGEDGALGLVMLQQALAMEETLFTSLFFANGALDGIQFPREYQPRNGPRWVPRTVRVGLSPDVPGLVNSFGIGDRASDLEALAALLRAGAELAFLASSTHGNAPLIDTLTSGAVFGPLPKTHPTGTGGGNGLITWEDGVGALLQRECTFCHDNQFKPEPGLFASNSYSDVRAGGRNSRPGSATPIVVPGDPENSVLYQVLRENPPTPFFRMPDGGPYLKAQDIDLVRRWIADGALSAPPAPPRIGRDLAVTMFRNLLGLHATAEGALVDRFDGDVRVPFVNSASTGLALQAMAAMTVVGEESRRLRLALLGAGDFAVKNLTSTEGDVVETLDLNGKVVLGKPSLWSHARMTAGLYAAGRAAASPAMRDRARVVGQRMLDRYFDAARGMFRTGGAISGSRFSPLVLAAVADALRAMIDDGSAEAGAAQEAFFGQIAPLLAFSELADSGEVLGDGIADTNGNGTPEPALAGGPFGRAPVFVGELLDGSVVPPTDGAITWTQHIQPLFRAKCGQCHMDGSSRGLGYLIDTPALARKGIDPNAPMPLIVPGDPDNSWLYQKLVQRMPVSGAQMPLQTPPLTDHGKELVRRWIAEGATPR